MCSRLVSLLACFTPQRICASTLSRVNACTQPRIYTSTRSLIHAFTLLLILPLPLAASAEDLTQNGQGAEEKIYIVNEYRYVPASATDDREIGLSLCGTRCNALSTDHRNISEPMGWQMSRSATNKELIVELNSQFIGGHCICVADEYVVTINDSNSIENRRPRMQDGSAVNN